ncbi:MAG: hypothetical protein ACRDS9_00845 [Pseudonocardiaceae bacterium]
MSEASAATGWSTSYRWMGVSRGDARGLANHDLRDPEVRPTNPDVDPSRTPDNLVLIADHNGDLRPLEPDEDGVDLVMARLEEKIASATKNTRRHKVKQKNPDTGRMEPTGEVREVEVALRKDAAVMVEIVLQLDPEFTQTGWVYDEHGEAVWEIDETGQIIRDAARNPVQKFATCADMTPEKKAEANRLLDVMIAEVRDQHPDADWLYLTKHFDETAPHVQLAFVPKTPDGRINYGQVMSGGARSKAAAQKHYSTKHDHMRHRLQDAGYDATMVRVDAGKRHLGLTAYKEEQARLREDTRERRLDLTNALDQWRDNERDERELRWRTQDLDTRQRDLENREAALDEHEADLPLRRRKATDEGRTQGRAEYEAEHDAWVAKLNHQTSDAEDREKSAEDAIKSVLEHQRRLDAKNQQAIADAVRRAQDADITAYLRQHYPDILETFARQQAESLKPPQPRLEMQARLPRTADRTDVELLVIHNGTTTQRETIWVDVQIRESDPRAHRQKGLHLATTPDRNGNQHPVIEYSRNQLHTIQQSAEDNRLERPAGGEILGVRADLLATGKSLILNTRTVRQGQPLTHDVMHRQRAHEDQHRHTEPHPSETRLDHHGSIPGNDELENE